MQKALTENVGVFFLCLNLTRQNWTVNIGCINLHFYTVFLHIIHYSKQV